MREIAEINNVAVEMIEKGHYRKAIQTLRQGNKILVDVMDRYHESGGDEVDKKSLAYDCTGNSWPQQASQASSTKQPQHFGFDDQRRPAGFSSHFVYRHPIRIRGVPSERPAYILSVIVLFNMALTYNLLALDLKKTNPLRKNLLRESLKLYQLTFVMKNQGKLHFDTTFALALVNNTAHIQSEMGRQAKAKKLIDLMLSTLMMVVQNGQTAMVPEIDGFMATASRLIVQPQMLAAAA